MWVDIGLYYSRFVMSTGVDNLSSHISVPKSSSVLKSWRERKNIFLVVHSSCRHNPVCPKNDVCFFDLLAWN